MAANLQVQEAIRARLERDPPVSQRALAAEMGLTPTQLGDYLRGRRRPRSTQILRMSGPLGVRPSELNDAAQQSGPNDEISKVLSDLILVARAMHQAMASLDSPDLLSVLQRAERCVEHLRD
jgi:transcriptional regulator with XRE-family HTH domain